MKKPAAAVFFIALFVLFVVLLAPRLWQIQALKKRQANLETELKRLKFENDQMNMELKLLREDPVYLEKVAREKFNKAKEGEIVYRVVREGSGD